MAKKKTRQDAPVLPETLSTAEDAGEPLTEYLYNGSTVASKTIEGKEYILRPGKPIKLPASEVTETLKGLRLLSEYRVRVAGH